MNQMRLNVSSSSKQTAIQGQIAHVTVTHLNIEGFDVVDVDVSVSQGVDKVAGLELDKNILVLNTSKR